METLQKVCKTEYCGPLCFSAEIQTERLLGSQNQGTVFNTLLKLIFGVFLLVARRPLDNQSTRTCPARSLFSVSVRKSLQFEMTSCVNLLGNVRS